jgi:hypothetical protein
MLVGTRDPGSEIRIRGSDGRVLVRCHNLGEFMGDPVVPSFFPPPERPVRLSVSIAS